MSHTGRNKKLASFNCDEQLWADFVSRCRERRTTATAVLVRFISLYLEGQLDYPDVHPGSARTDNLEEQRELIKGWVDEYLSCSRDNQQDLQAQVTVLSERVATLESRLLELSKSKKPTLSREFWFIKDRAKYLGLEVSADRILHIELYANGAYKERHGKLPSRQNYRNTQAYAYHNQDVDILDAAIKKVVGEG